MVETLTYKKIGRISEENTRHHQRSLHLNYFQPKVGLILHSHTSSSVPNSRSTFVLPFQLTSNAKHHPFEIRRLMMLLLFILILTDHFCWDLRSSQSFLLEYRTISYQNIPSLFFFHPTPSLSVYLYLFSSLFCLTITTYLYCSSLFACLLHPNPPHFVKFTFLSYFFSVVILLLTPFLPRDFLWKTNQKTLLLLGLSWCCICIALSFLFPCCERFIVFLLVSQQHLP